MRTQTWHSVVVVGRTTVTGHGGGTPTKPNVAWKPYLAWLASNASTVRRWDDSEVAAVVEKR